MREIPLTNSDKVAIVDDDMYEELSRWKWHLSTSGYAHRTPSVYTSNGRTSKHIPMHRHILGLGSIKEDPVHVDHINGNTLDNRRENLRIATCSQNSANRRMRKDNTSGYKGVSWRKQRQKWEAYITINGKRKLLGLFDCKHEAARAYNEAAIKLFGEFAKLNEIPSDVEGAEKC